MASATDDFNRASLGASWTQRRTFFGSVTIVSSTYASGASSGMGVQATYPTATSGNDQYAEAKLAGFGSLFGSSAGVVVRMSGQDSSGTDTRNFYYLVATDTGTTQLVLGRCINGTETVIWSANAAAVNTDLIRLEVQGTTLRAYWKGVLQTTQTDANIASGEAGLTAPGNSVGMDDWAAGDLGPQISAQPSDQTVNNGATATFSVTASGTGLTYQWQDNSSGSFADIGGATGSSYAPTASYAMQGRQYRCVVTDSGSNSVTSSAATLRVVFNLSGTGPRAYPKLGAPFGAGTTEAWLRGSAASGSTTTVAPGTGHLALSGKQPTISQTITTTVAPGAGHLVLSGKAPTISQTITTTVAPGKGSLTLTGYAPSILRTTALTPGTGHLLLGGYAPTVARLATVAPGSGHLGLTGYAPSIVRITALTPGTGHALLTGYAPTVSQSGAVAITPGTGHLTLAGYAPVVTRTSNQAVTPGTGHAVLTGYAPSITRQDVIVPGTGHLLLSGKQPTVSQTANLTLSPGSGHLLLTGYAPTVVRTANQAVSPGTGHLVLAGHAPSVSNGGAVFPAPADVRAGVQYGPTGTEYTGTSAGGGSYLRRR